MLNNSRLTCEGRILNIILLKSLTSSQSSLAPPSSWLPLMLWLACKAPLSSPSQGGLTCRFSASDSGKGAKKQDGKMHKKCLNQRLNERDKRREAFANLVRSPAPSGWCHGVLWSQAEVRPPPPRSPPALSQSQRHSGSFWTQLKHKIRE